MDFHCPSVLDCDEHMNDSLSVREMFSAIAKRYDLANHLLSGGCDFLWRRRVAHAVATSVPSPQRILDLATGSGDLALALARACPEAEIIGADFCPEMLAIARAKGVAQTVEADAFALPFPDAAFDALTVGFGLRNMIPHDAALTEMARVLRDGGILAVLDFSMPTHLARPYRFYLHKILPHIAGVIAGSPDAYRYLGNSIENFPRGQAMLDLIERTGFSGAKVFSQTFGVASLYIAHREPRHCSHCDG